MPPNANAPTEGRSAAENNSVICTATCTAEYDPCSPDNQVSTLIDRRVQALWRTFQLALEVDLIEHTPESKLLRTLAHRTWGAVFLEAI